MHHSPQLHGKKMHPLSTSRRERIKVVSVKLSSRLLGAGVILVGKLCLPQGGMDAKGGKRCEEVIKHRN